MSDGVSGGDVGEQVCWIIDVLQAMGVAGGEDSVLGWCDERTDKEGMKVPLRRGGEVAI